ncbi:MAG: hypothetical protein ABSA79_00365 [Candidatus Bathyarchaeia archaeon]|jgi:ethanolamine utilization protein EutQ (cupin superfamily)
MSIDSEILKQLKTKKIRVETNREIIKKVIKDKFGYELPLEKSTYLKTSDSGRENLERMVNVLFEALAEAVEEIPV